MKNRNRDPYTFANINLLGKCNADCFFCLGKDLTVELEGQNQLAQHFATWKNFLLFITRCKAEGVRKLYITGQNTDSLMYKYLDELVDTLHYFGFQVGLRTNGYLAYNCLDTINKCELSTGYSIHSLNPYTINKILGRYDYPTWEYIIPETKNCRMQIVVNQYNAPEFPTLVKYISQFSNVKYIQARRISTDRRQVELQPHIDAYEDLYCVVRDNYPLKGRIYGDCEIYNIHGKDVCFWRTVKTTANSLNYFTDGTVSDEYFIVEGYLKNRIPNACTCQTTHQHDY